jgi:probable biosynthetic protein (TIGR04098 family)
MNAELQYTDLIRTIVPGFEDASLESPLEQGFIDSIDLVTIRVELENLIGQQIPDSRWMKFGNLAEVIEYCQAIRTQEHSGGSSEGIGTGEKKHFRINMPQMAIEALSENWLFKEQGDLHWDLLCKGLNTSSLLLTDEAGNRLYATFVRIRIQSNVPLNTFTENESVEVGGSIKRFGNGMYFSKINFEAENGNILTEMMTSFSIRNETDNTKLMKSQPGSKVNFISEYSTFPVFGNEYRLVKKGELKEIVLGGVSFNITDDILFSTPYELNPYYDLNGVGLLYFAAYPVISDVCEGRHFNKQEKGAARWEQKYYTVARDVLYFANCNINDRIIYRLHSYEIRDGKAYINSSLQRESDGTLMARIFTIKQAKA